MTHDEALLVARGGELVQLASESSKRIDSTTGAIHVARAFDTHLPERDRAAQTCRSHSRCSMGKIRPETLDASHCSFFVCVIMKS